VKAAGRVGLRSDRGTVGGRAKQDDGVGNDSEPEGSWTVPECIDELDDDWESSEPGRGAGGSGAWRVCALLTATRNAQAKCNGKFCGQDHWNGSTAKLNDG
jgi:hypothetical protein